MPSDGEEGVQDAARAQLGSNPKENEGPAGLAEVTAHNPLGRAAPHYASAADLERASIIFVRNLDTAGFETVIIPH